jgi:hypothetical protein
LLNPSAENIAVKSLKPASYYNFMAGLTERYSPPAQMPAVTSHIKTAFRS